MGNIDLHDRLKADGWVKYTSYITGDENSARIFADLALDIQAGNVRDPRIYPFTELISDPIREESSAYLGESKTQAGKIRLIYVLPSENNQIDNKSVSLSNISLEDGRHFPLPTRGLSRSIRKD